MIIFRFAYIKLSLSSTIWHRELTGFFKYNLVQRTDWIFQVQFGTENWLDFSSIIWYRELTGFFRGQALKIKLREMLGKSESNDDPIELAIEAGCSAAENFQVNLKCSFDKGLSWPTLSLSPLCLLNCLYSKLFLNYRLKNGALFLSKCNWNFLIVCYSDHLYVPKNYTNEGFCKNGCGRFANQSGATPEGPSLKTS